MVERKPRGRGHERRDEILSGAARLFVEFGFANVTTRRIADELGISQTALYVYFPNKDAILDELCERCFARLVATFEHELAQGGDALHKLKRLMHAYIDFGISNPDEYRITFMLEHEHGTKDFSLTNPEPPAGVTCYLMLQNQVAELGKLGRLSCDATLASQALWAAGHGLVSLLITMHSFPWAPRETLISQALEIQLNGLLKAPG